MAHCCAQCGKEEGGGGVSLKACKSCMQVKYCDATCQKNHWPKHKTPCKLRAAELRDEALFKDPPPKEDCPICFLPMPIKLLSCMTLPPATLSSVPIHDFATANEGLVNEDMEKYYSCCAKSICRGCMHSFNISGNNGKCPFCNSDQADKTEEEMVVELMKRVEANDAGAVWALGISYYQGLNGLQQDWAKAIELLTRSADLGYSKAHLCLGGICHDGGAPKKAKFHWEAAAMAGNEEARYNLGTMEYDSGNIERAIKHYIIGASAGDFIAMHHLREFFENGFVSRESMDSTLTAYNNSCAEMRSKARDAYICAMNNTATD